MIFGVGIDLVRISRMEAAIGRWGGRLMDRLFTAREQEYCLRYRQPAPHFAARFAAKEATIKALGWPRDAPFGWAEVETINDPSGRPHLSMTGHVRTVATRLGVEQICVSLSHDRDYAIAYVMVTQGTVGAR